MTTTDYSLLRHRMVDWLSSYLEDTGKAGYVIGLSGGIDSLTLSLLANEVAQRTNKKFLAIISKIDPTYDYTDNEYATKVVDMYSLSHEFLDLTESYAALKKILPASSRPVTYTNLKARLRTAVFYYYANNHNLLVLGTVNCGEFMIGYFPKNASAGDILPMAELSKHEIRGIAETYGVPTELRNRKASGCVFAQTAEEEWGFTEDDLDVMCETILTNRSAPLDNIPPDKREDFFNRHKRSVHKRIFYPIFCKE